jgi:hypothetical protein
MDLQPRLDQPKHSPQSSGEQVVIVHSRRIIWRNPVEPAQSLADEQSRKWRQIIAPPAIAYQGFQTPLFIPHPVESSRHALERYVYPSITKGIASVAGSLVLAAFGGFVRMAVPVTKAIVAHCISDKRGLMPMLVEEPQSV